MGSLAALAGGAVVAFAATNVDDLFVLALFLGDPRWRIFQVVAGQYAGIGALVLLSVVGASTTLLIPQEWIRYLGVLPLAIGLKHLLASRVGERESEAVDGAELGDAPSGFLGGRILTVATVTFANGGDNVGVYVPLFAGLHVSDLIAVAAVFATMTGLWCTLSHALVRHPLLGRPVRRHGRHVASYVLILLGLAILLELTPA